jgi:probable rRNA maturation factor
MDGAPPDVSEDRIEILIETEEWRTIPDIDACVRAAARLPLSLGKRSNNVICILLTDDSTVQRLNRVFRDQDRSTNVLSFPARTAPHQDMLGDIALAYETIAREAEEQKKPLLHHVQHLTIHGVLHLLGFDHETEAKADRMEAIETKLLASLAIPDPYSNWHTGD